MGLIVDLSPLLPCGVFSNEYDELLLWLEECIGPRVFNKKAEPDKFGIIPFCQSNNWRLLTVSYAVRRAYPDAKLPASGWALEFSSDSDLLMFKLRWF